MSYDTCQGKLVRDSVPQVFVGGWSCRHSLLSMYQNSRLTEGNQVVGINHIVCTSSLSTLNHSIQGKFYISVGNCLLAKFPDTSQGPTNLACRPKDSSLGPAILTLFWIPPHNNLPIMLVDFLVHIPFHTGAFVSMHWIPRSKIID